MSNEYEKIADKYTATTDPLLIRMTRSMFIAELETAVRNAIVQREAHAQGATAYESCSRCGGSGLMLGGAGEPTECSACKGNTVVRTPAACEHADYVHGRLYAYDATSQTFDEAPGKFDGDRVTILQADFEGLMADRRELAQARAQVEGLKGQLAKAEAVITDIAKGSFMDETMYPAIRAAANYRPEHSSTVRNGDEP